MKKSCALILSVVVLVASLFTAGVSADTVSGGAVVASSDLQSYKTYRSAISDSADATTSVSKKGADFASFSGSVEKADNYEGKANVAKFITEKSSASYTINVLFSGDYNIELTYIGLKGRNNPIKLGLMIDGAIPFDGVQEFEVPRLWKDSGDVRADGMGNEFSPSQEEVFQYNTKRIVDASGLEDMPFKFYLTSGSHTITITSVAEPVAIASIDLVAPLTYKSYEEVKASYGNETAENTIKIEGENAVLKTTNSLVSKADSSDPRMSSKNGQSPYLSRVNYIGNTNWQMPGEIITWKFTADKAGLYKVGFRYRQNYVLNGSSYRKLLIDGEVPFAEAANIKFNYGINWDYKEWTDDNNDPYLLYLDAGEHTISMEVCLGEMTALVNRLQAVMYDVGVMYRKIVMITGETPDANRDYALFNQIPDLEEVLTSCDEELESIASGIEELAGANGGSYASSIRSMSNVLEKMLDFRLAAHTYKSLYYTNYTSVAALVYDMMKMALSIDYIELAPTEAEFDHNRAGFFEKTWFSMQRFLGSFSANYNNISGDSDADETITIWINWGRDQVRVLNDLIQSSFTPKTGIGVNLKISNASYIQGILSGNGPDCSLHMARSTPVNLALRSSMYNLENFPDYEQVIKRYMSEDAVLPFKFQGGTYALSDTTSFYMLFYRTDILGEYGLKVPTTWEEYIEVASFLMRHNLQCSLPYIKLTQITQVDSGVAAFSIFPSMLIQRGGSIYKDDLSATNLTSATALETFEFWTNFYNEYKFPITADFFNRFRIGVMPMGIQSYTEYISLTMAAPEISGKWAMAPIPGYVEEDGTINNSQAGSGTGCGILNISKNKKGGWEFLKWWTSAETQLAYSDNCESILGVSGRVATSNVEAFKQMGWDSASLNALITQWQRLQEIPEVPGGYYTARVIDQAYWNVVNNSKNSKDMLVKWAGIADNEIARKRAQYNVK